MRRAFKRAVLSIAIISLFGCSPITKALWETSSNTIIKKNEKKTNLSDANLDKNFQHMHVTVMNQSFFMTKVDTKKTNKGIIETWITPANEIVRTIDGRISQTTGSAYAEWTHTEYINLISWRSIVLKLDAGQTIQYLRHRDVEPGGLYGIQELVTIRASHPDTSSPIEEHIKNVHWFEEIITPIDSAGRMKYIQKNNENYKKLIKPLPSAKFGVLLNPQGSETVIFSKQCLSQEICLTFQRWPEQKLTTTANKN